jgi:histidyl-tRNA synthetase
MRKLIERLAMLVGEHVQAPLEIILALENNQASEFAYRKLSELRREGFIADIVATGSPKKRFDKAVKSGASRIASIGFDGNGPTISLRGGDVDTQRTTRIHAILAP